MQLTDNNLRNSISKKYNRNIEFLNFLDKCVYNLNVLYTMLIEWSVYKNIST